VTLPSPVPFFPHFDPTSSFPPEFSYRVACRRCSEPLHLFFAFRLPPLPSFLVLCLPQKPLLPFRTLEHLLSTLRFFSPPGYSIPVLVGTPSKIFQAVFLGPCGFCPLSMFFTPVFMVFCGYISGFFLGLLARVTHALFLPFVAILLPS